MTDRPTIAVPGVVFAAVALTAAAAIGVSLLHPMRTGSHATAPAAATLDLPYGPTTRTRMPTASPVAYLKGGGGAAAVLDASSRPATTAALHLLTEAGIPAIIAPTPADAVRQPFIVWQGAVAPADVTRLERYATGGGVVLLDPAGAALAGATDPVIAPRTAFTLLPGGGIPADAVAFPEVETTGYRKAVGTLARFTDGTTAIPLRRIGRGLVVSLPLPLEQLVLTPEAGAEPPPDGTAGRDALALLVRTLYLLTGGGVALGGAPDGSVGALVLVHDLDRPEAYEGAEAIARLETDRGIRATFAATTRTAASGPDPLLTPRSASVLRRLVRAGAGIAAGGIEPSRIATATPGGGAETHPGYAPSREHGGTTLTGEARVSRFLLEAVTGHTPTTFVPPTIPTDAGFAGRLDGALAASAYTTAVSVLADRVGGSLPFRAAQDGDGDELPVLRLPVGLDGTHEARIDRRGAELARLVAHAAATGAPATVRVSPAGGTVATFALQRLLADTPDDVWVGSAEAFTATWSARYTLTIDVAIHEGAVEVTLRAPGAVSRQTLLLPFAATSARTADGRSLNLAGDGRRIVVPAFARALTIEVVARPVTAP